MSRPVAPLRCFVLALVVLGSLLGVAEPTRALPEGQWYALESGETTFFGNVDRADLATLVEGAGLLREALRSTEPFLAEPPSPTLVYLFRDADAYRPYQHREGGGPAFVDGTHFGRPHAGYVTLNAASPRATRALAHELVHRRLPPSIPRWAEEGLAEVYASVSLDEGRLRVGLPDPAHAETLAGDDWLPVSDLLAVEDLGAPRYRVGRARVLFYAQSWLLAHWLWSEPDRRADFARSLAEGRPPRLPAPSILDAALRRHLEAGPPPIEIRPASSPRSPVPRTPEAMRYADALFHLGDLLLIQGGRESEATEHFRTALGIDSGHGRALGGLAVVAERAGDRPTARERYARAVDLAPDDALLRFRRGRNLLPTEPVSPLGADFDLARAELENALDLAPDERWLRDAVGWLYLVRLVALADAERFADARRVLDAYRAVVPEPERAPVVRAVAARLAAEGR